MAFSMFAELLSHYHVAVFDSRAHAFQARTFLFFQLLLLLLQRNQESVYEQISEETLPNPHLWIPSRAPVAIGVAAMSTAQMLASGLKGKGFSVLHTYQDHLWWVHCLFCYGGGCVGRTR